MRSLELIQGGRCLCLSILAFGTGSVGKTISYEDSAAMLDRYLACGGSCIDTARMYGGGASEETIGRYLRQRGCREKVVISTKGGFPPKEDMHHSRIRPEPLMQDLEESLRALGTDCVDLYFLHRDDLSYPVEELMPFLDGLVRSGKVGFLGASNWTAARIHRANRFARENGLTPFSVSQIQWSLAQATPDSWGDDTIVCMNREEANFYIQEEMPVMAFTPLTRGFFSKAITYGIDDSRLDAYLPFKTPTNIERVQRVAALCRQKGVTPAQLCHAYLTSGQPKGIAVLGAKSLSHLEDSLAGADLLLSEDEMKFLSVELSPQEV